MKALRLFNKVINSGWTLFHWLFRLNTQRISFALRHVFFRLWQALISRLHITVNSDVSWVILHNICTVSLNYYTITILQPLDCVQDYTGFTGARDNEWQWHQLGHKSAPLPRQITMPVSHHSVFLQAGCPSCRPTNIVKALIANHCLPEIYKKTEWNCYQILNKYCFMPFLLRDAMLLWYMLFVCMSVTSLCSTKTAKHKITQHCTIAQGLLSFLSPKISSKFEWGHYQQAPIAGGVG